MKGQLLDPLGTLCKLVSLCFYKVNTKLSIHNHVLILQQPTQMQFILRYCNGDARENISELYFVIIRIVKWYFDIDQSELDKDINIENEANWKAISQSIELKTLVKYTCMSFEKLQKTYHSGNTVLALQFYINLLKDAIDGHAYLNEKLPKNFINEHDSLIDFDKLRNLWDIRRLNRICKIYDSCFEVYNDPNITENERENLIDGYLKSINSFLEITDNDFQMLVTNSTKG
jgi:hypothetical protein